MALDPVENLMFGSLHTFRSLLSTVSATYYATGAEGASVTGFWQDRQMADQRFDDGKMYRVTGRFVVTKSDVASPKPGEKFSISGTDYAIEENGIHDSRDGSWELNLLSLTPTNVTAQRKGIDR